MTRRERPAAEGPDVVIVGAGPAGLVLGNLLLAAGIDCLVVERGSRDHVVNRARAGFLAPNTIRVLTENGLADGLLAQGNPHDLYYFRGSHEQFELRCGELGSGGIHTVYAQQELVRDLVEAFEKRGGRILFESTVLRMRGLTGDRPSVEYRDAGGRARELVCRYVAGCDGGRGASWRAVPPEAVRRYECDHGVSWLAILVRAPQSVPAVVYAMHEEGFAGHMARNAETTRYYLQCEPTDQPRDWPAERVWAELDRRMQTGRYGPLRQGPIVERRVVHLRSEVAERLQYGRLYLAGDAGSLINPTAAKGANLAVMAAHTLATAMTAALGLGDERLLERYSADCLPRIWRAHEFSQWMLTLLHAPRGESPRAGYLRALRDIRLAELRDSRLHQDFFADGYVRI